LRCRKKTSCQVIIASVDEYSLLLDLITDQDGATTLAAEKTWQKSFHVSFHYDTSIFNYFTETIFKAVLQMVKP
jgi:phosphoribosylaminoimidazolecarboxamide formyltransferase/IMP cyclohydrolase